MKQLNLPSLLALAALLMSLLVTSHMSAAASTTGVAQPAHDVTHRFFDDDDDGDDCDDDGDDDDGDDDDDDDDGDDDDGDDGDDDNDDCLPIFEPGEVVIKLAPNSGATVSDINSTYGTSIIETLLASSDIYLLRTPGNNGDVETVVADMQDDGRLLYAEPNFIGSPPESSLRKQWSWGGADTQPFPTQYAADMLALDEAHAVSTGATTVVAVLDTGFQLDHPELSVSFTEARYDFVDDDDVPDEDFAAADADGDGIADGLTGHGTHVAGIVHLIAPDAQIMPLRVLDAEGRGNVFLIAEAVLYAGQHGADVINLSLGTARESEFLADVIKDAIEENIVIVAAAGNLNSEEPQFPAAAKQVVAVASVDQAKQRSDFSNFGEWIGVAAPGSGIYSPFPLNGYATWSGTSMSTPFVAGQAALIHSAEPTLKAEQIVKRVLDTAEPATDELGAGVINVVASLPSAAPPDGNGEPAADNRVLLPLVSR